MGWGVASKVHFRRGGGHAQRWRYKGKGGGARAFAKRFLKGARVLCCPRALLRHKGRTVSRVCVSSWAGTGMRPAWPRHRDMRRRAFNRRAHAKGPLGWQRSGAAEQPHAELLLLNHASIGWRCCQNELKAGLAATAGGGGGGGAREAENESGERANGGPSKASRPPCLDTSRKHPPTAPLSPPFTYRWAEGHLRFPC